MRTLVDDIRTRAAGATEEEAADRAASSLGMLLPGLSAMKCKVSAHKSVVLGSTAGVRKILRNKLVSLGLPMQAVLAHKDLGVDTTMALRRAGQPEMPG